MVMPNSRMMITSADAEPSLSESALLITAALIGLNVKPNFTVANEAAISAPPKVDFNKPAAPPPAPAKTSAAPSATDAIAAAPALAPGTIRGSEAKRAEDAPDPAAELMKKGY